MMLGPISTQSSPITKTRKPFLNMAKGKTKQTSASRRQGRRKNRFAATMLVINNTQLDRMPLHSFPTSIAMSGNWKRVPSRRIGMPEILKSKFAASVEASCEAVSRFVAIMSGIGTMKIRNATGKTAAAVQSRPRKKRTPAQKKDTNESATALR